MKVLYQESPGIPLAAATLLLRTGSIDESPAQSGIANLTAEILLQGTRRRSAHQIAYEMESIGASLSCHASEDFTEFGFTAPMAKLDKALAVLVDVLAHPRFLPYEIEKEREHILADLQSRTDTIFNKAYDRFNSIFYGTHPYSWPTEGKKETVRSFSRRQIVHWYKGHFLPKRSILSIVSSLPTRGVKRLLEQSFSAWRSNIPLREPLRAALPSVEETEVSVKADFEQAYLMTGVSAPGATDLRYAQLKVLNTLVGGGMSSRLFLKLREEAGLAYEVSSFFPTRLFTSQWVFYLGLPPNKLPRARQMLEQILEDLQSKPPSREEVRQAIKMIRGSYLMELQTRRRQAWYAAWWTFLGRDVSYGHRFLRQLEQITPGQLRNLARDLLGQPRVTIEITPK